MAPLPPTTLSPERQAELDHLYWHTDRTATSIANEYAVTPHRLATMVSPLPAGVECWLCHAPLCYRNRSERAQAMKLATTKWGGRLVCPCGAQQLRGLLREGLTDTDAAILAPLYTPHGHARRQDPWARYGYYPGTPSRSAVLVQDGVEALAAVGLRWCGTFVKVDELTSPAALVEQLEQTLDTRVLVVPSLTEAMCNEGDSLALFLLLVGRGWRVISSARGVPQGGGYDGWIDEFPASESVVAAAHAPMLRLV